MISQIFKFLRNLSNGKRVSKNLFHSNLHLIHSSPIQSVPFAFHVLVSYWDATTWRAVGDKGLRYNMTFQQFSHCGLTGHCMQLYERHFQDSRETLTTVIRHSCECRSVLYLEIKSRNGIILLCRSIFVYSKCANHGN